MKILDILVDELPEGCAGKYIDHCYPEPCPFFMVGEGLWCCVTGKSIEENNDPYNQRPNWCPLRQVWVASYKKVGL